MVPSGVTAVSGLAGAQAGAAGREVKQPGRARADPALNEQSVGLG